MMREALRRVPDFAWLMLLAVIVMGAGLGLRDPWPADEPRFALIAREMVESGQWFFPRVANVLYPDKPPVFFWLIAGFYALTGSLRVAFLLPSLLAGIGTLLLVHDLGKRLWNERVGFYAAATLLLTLQFSLQVRTAQIDATLMFWTTLGLYGLCRHLLLGPSWGWYMTGFAAAGAGIITKGVGFLPVLVLLPWAVARWRHWPLPAVSSGWRWSLGPLSMLAVIGAWFIPMLLLVAASHDPAYAAYRDNILFKQTAERYAESWHHIKPFWYYIVEVIPVFWLPVTAALPWLMPAWRRDLQQKDSRLLLLLGWVVLVVVFFTLSPGKRGVYLLPAVPALALAAAPWAQQLLARRRLQYTGFAILAVFTLLFWLALVYFTQLRPDKGDALVARYLFEPWTFFVLLGSLGAAWMLMLPKRGMYALCGFFLSMWLAYGCYGYPLLNPARTPAALMQQVGERIGPEGELALVAWKEQMILQADRPVVHFGYRLQGSKKEITRALYWLTAAADRYVLLPREVHHRCLRADGVEFIALAHGIDWKLADSADVDRQCLSRFRQPPQDSVVIYDGKAEEG